VSEALTRTDHRFHYVWCVTDFSETEVSVSVSDQIFARFVVWVLRMWTWTMACLSITDTYDCVVRVAGCARLRRGWCQAFSCVCVSLSLSRTRSLSRSLPLSLLYTALLSSGHHIEYGIIRCQPHLIWYQLQFHTRIIVQCPWNWFVKIMGGSSWISEQVGNWARLHQACIKLSPRHWGKVEPIYPRSYRG
jgi:hypothetical protein